MRSPACADCGVQHAARSADPRPRITLSRSVTLHGAVSRLENTLIMDGSIILGGLILVSLGQLLVLRDHVSSDEGTKAPISNSALQD